MSAVSSLIRKIRNKGVKHIIMHTLPYKINEKIMDLVSCIGYRLYSKKPLQDVIIIESHNDFDSNGGAYYEYLIANGYNKTYKIVWFLRNDCPKNLPENVEGYRYNKPSFKRVYYHCIAKFIVCGHFMIPSIKEGQKSYYTTHGPFCLKTFKGNINIPESMTYILTPSEYLKEILANEYCIKYPNDRQIILGYSAHDTLFNSEEGDLNKITKENYKKVILWMPTFRRSVDGRQDGDTDNSLGIPIIDTLDAYYNLNKKLKDENVLLVIKIHPMQDMSTVKIKSLSNIILLDGASVKKIKVDNYRLMKDADALISDYSSVAYEYLHLNRPIAYTMDDLKEYSLGLIVSEPEKMMAGKIVYTFNDFNEFIDDVISGNDTYKEERQVLYDKIWKYHDGNSSERLAKHMGL